jgi:serine/threonine protein kinase/alpha-beta hydrolase superfamily lysophospholipase
VTMNLWQRLRGLVRGEPGQPQPAPAASDAPVSFALSASDLPGAAWAGAADREARLGEALRGRYALSRVIGRGGMSTVFLAQDVRHDRQVALKAMVVDRGVGSSAERFHAEIRVTAGLHHPNILPLFDSGEAGGSLYYVMPYIEGESLAARLARERPLPLEAVVSIVTTVAAALDHAHASGIVHRDIKPGNVLLQERSTYVADFGISLALAAAAAGPRLTKTGATLGTPLYMSPEQIDGDEIIDGRADVYALGCMAYEMLTGEPPFGGSTGRAIMLRHLHDPVPSAATLRQGLGPAVDASLARAMAKVPADRFPTAGAFAEALVATLASPSTAPSAVSRASAPWRLEQEIRFCTTEEGVRIAYATSGAGLPLVKTSNWLSHLEFDATSPMWRHWWMGLSQKHRLIRYDERGTGLSDRKVEEISLEAWVRDLEAVVDEAGLERFALLGVSRGGAIAIEYAARHPERVSHLVLHGAYAIGGRARGHPAGTRMAEMELEMVRLGWGKSNPAHRQAFTTLFFPEATAEQMQWFNQLQQVSASPENAARMLAASYDLDVSEAAKTITTPTLIFHCTRDARIRFEEGRRLAGLVPGARFVSLDSANHIPLDHEPAWAQFLDELWRFTT